jgi:Na+/citrate or Na+/malate symporter
MHVNCIRTRVISLLAAINLINFFHIRSILELFFSSNCQIALLFSLGFVQKNLHFIVNAFDCQNHISLVSPDILEAKLNLRQLNY